MADRAEKRFKKPAEKAKADLAASEAEGKSNEPASTTPENQRTSTPMNGGAEDIAAIAARHISERRANAERHDRERSQMHARHEKDFKDLYSRHEEELAGLNAAKSEGSADV